MSWERLELEGTREALETALAGPRARARRVASQAALLEQLHFWLGSAAIIGLLVSMLVGFTGNGWPWFYATLATGAASLAARAAAARLRWVGPDRRRVGLVARALTALAPDRSASLRLELGPPDRPEAREGGPNSRVFRDAWLELETDTGGLQAEETCSHTVHASEHRDVKLNRTYTSTSEGRSSSTLFRLRGPRAPATLPAGCEARRAGEGWEVEVQRYDDDVAEALGDAFGQALAS
ncbi:MAG: hypothetical protein AB7N76_15080 [Planctomycetota bacterium]